MTKLSTIELYKQNMKFAAGHFTIFSATEREKMHGHNYQVYVGITTLVTENGLKFDYRYYKQKILQLCRSLNEVFLLPAHSEHLRIEEQEDYYLAHFNGKKLPFLKADVVILPVNNVTVEELSDWFLQQLTADKKELSKNDVQSMVVKVSSSPGQSGSATWDLNNA